MRIPIERWRGYCKPTREIVWGCRVGGRIGNPDVWQFPQGGLLI